MSDLPAESLAPMLDGFFDPDWYLVRYPDIATAGVDPLDHFIRYGAAERRDPNRFFDGAWYLESNPDVAASGMHPLLHYLQAGARELRRPHPRFDAAWYVAQHPEAAQNPLLWHMRVGLGAGHPTEPTLVIEAYQPSTLALPLPPPGVFTDAVIVVRGGDGAPAARACLQSVLADRALPLARIIVVEDGAITRGLSDWLRTLAEDGQIHLIRLRHRAGFAEAAGRGIRDAEGHDVVLLDGAAVLPPGWLRRLAGHAHAVPEIGAVAPLGAEIGPGWCATPRRIDGEAQMPATRLDALCARVNAGRTTDLAATAGPCLYLKAPLLAALGPLTGGETTQADTAADVLTETCLRAAALGWKIRLAWDCYVATPQAPAVTAAPSGLLARHPGGRERIEENLAATEPFQFALNAALARETGLPVLVMVSHNYGGGVRRHIQELAVRCAGRAVCLSLEGGDQAVTLGFLGARGNPALTLAPGRIDDLAEMLQQIGVSRLHIHHLLRVEMDIQRLIRRLGVPFDVTVHDYFAICPQMNMLPWPEGRYCNEPPAAVCNACIAENNPHGARDIFVWRREKTWLFTEADRVICPSRDVKDRLQRYGLAERAVVAPHHPQPEATWRSVLPRLAGPPLRVAVLGVLANHKGARVVAAVAAAAGTLLSIRLIGHVEPSFPPDALPLIRQTGRYEEDDLPRLLAEIDPHVIWLPSTCPETFSYTLSTAIDTGRPIVATRLGALPERLEGRPLTWLVDDRAETADWLDVFRQVQAALRARPDASATAGAVPRRVETADFYADAYLRPPRRRAAAAVRTRRRIAIVPERDPGGRLTPAAYQRLLLPLDHAAGADHDILISDLETVAGQRADAIVTHRHACATPEAATRLLAQARTSGAALIYDLDDDLAHPAEDEAAGAEAAARADAVHRLLSGASAVWLSSPRLAHRLDALRPDAVVLETRLDERIWDLTPPPAPFWPDPVRILCMGNVRHEQDFALIEPALVRLRAEYGDRVSIDIIGMSSRSILPGGIERPPLTPQAGRSYPAFVQWLTGCRPGWDIGLAPMLDTPANRWRSDVRALDYAALGLFVLASDVPAYRGSVADGAAGRLVANRPEAWYAALNWAIRDQALRQAGYDRARAAFLAHGTLAEQRGRRLAALEQAMGQREGSRRATGRRRERTEEMQAEG